MKWISVMVLAVMGLGLWAPVAMADEDELVLYCGRKEAYVKPIIDRFEQETGIKVTVRYAKTPVLAAQVKEEGEKTPADLFWAQDVAALGSLSEAGLLATIADRHYDRLIEGWVASNKRWIATSGRARVLAYNPKLMEGIDFPESVFDLTDPKYKGKVGWAPTNGSFKAFVTAMRLEHGDEKTLEWLKGMKENDPVAYPKNTPIIKGLANEEVALGIPNHYYLLRFKVQDKDYPVEQKFFKDGDIGNLMFVAGLGMLNSSDSKDAADKFIEFVLSDNAQKYITYRVFEYPVVKTVTPDERLVDQEKLDAVQPEVNVESIKDLDGTTKLLKEAGVIK